MSDTELLHAIARGDAQAFAAFYDRYNLILFGFLLRILHSNGEAEDVLQEVFIQVWQQASDFDETRGRPFTWLMMMARSRAIDRLRALDSRERSAERASYEASNEIVDAFDEAIRSEQSEMVRRALAEIPEEPRRALLLAYFEGLSQSEIAARIGKPLGTVKTRTRTGLRKLRELLRDKLGRKR